jgi:galactonate dehydratase
MRIADFECHRIPVNHRGDWIFVRVADDLGNAGWGEASSSGDDDAAIAAMTEMVSRLLQVDHDPDVLLAQIRQSAPAEKIPRTAASAVEHAVTELAARCAGTSVAETFADGGSTKDAVPIYANLNRMCRDRSPDTAAAAARKAVAGGLKRVKFAPFDEVTPDGLVREGTGIAEPGADRLRALRDAIGPDIALMVDCHWRFTPETVPYLGDLARELDIGWIEDPLPELDPDEMQRLRDLSGARIAGGEALLLQEDFEALIRSRAVDVLIADVKFVGGVGPLDWICKLAADQGITFAPHNPSGPIATAASAHVVAANSNAEVLEFPFGEVPWRTDLAAGESLIEDRLAVAGPGYGVALMPDKAGTRAT